MLERSPVIVSILSIVPRPFHLLSRINVAPHSLTLPIFLNIESAVLFTLLLHAFFIPTVRSFQAPALCISNSRYFSVVQASLAPSILGLTDTLSLLLLQDIVPPSPFYRLKSLAFANDLNNLQLPNLLSFGYIRGTSLVESETTIRPIDTMPKRHRSPTKTPLPTTGESSQSHHAGATPSKPYSPLEEFAPRAAKFISWPPKTAAPSAPASNTAVAGRYPTHQPAGWVGSPSTPPAASQSTEDSSMWADPLVENQLQPRDPREPIRCYGNFIGYDLTQPQSLYHLPTLSGPCTPATTVGISESLAADTLRKYHRQCGAKPTDVTASLAPASERKGTTAMDRGRTISNI